jgi:hypothetical protein
MKFFHHFKQQTKARGRASAESSLDTSAAAPDSGFTFVKNSQGASAAVAELSRCLDTAIDQIELDGMYFFYIYIYIFLVCALVELREKKKKISLGRGEREALKADACLAWGSRGSD